MRKAITICLLILFTATNTELGQFLKLPVLVRHYIKHYEQEAMSFVAFVTEHYGNNHEDEDKKDDMQLPFKSPMGNLPVIASLSIESLELASPLPEPSEIFIQPVITFIPSQIIFQVFHPPRTV